LSNPIAGSFIELDIDINSNANCTLE